MKVEGWFFGFIGVFMGVGAAIYWFMSHEPTGTVCMVLSSLLGFLCAFYLLFTGKRIGAQPQEQPQAEISDGAGVVGHFSPNSTWPLVIGIGVSLGMLGIIFGLWLALAGVILVAIGIPKLVLEYSSGPRNAHEELLHR